MHKLANVDALLAELQPRFVRATADWTDWRVGITTARGK